MLIEEIFIEDIESIKALQPTDWPDIIPHIKFYVSSSFCYPIKIKTDNKIVGIGCAICHPNAAWLAHIIVHPDYRNRGIGYTIVDELVKKLNLLHYKTILLIATKMGEPVYKKVGFKSIGEYVALKKETALTRYPLPKEIIPFKEGFESAIFKMDKMVTGEDRINMLRSSLHTAKLYIREEKLIGYYISDLGEGLIIADDVSAGIELMKLKYSTIDKAALPLANQPGHDFLISEGFAEKFRGPKMILGDDIQWFPEKIYSRIGGNLG